MSAETWRDLLPRLRYKDLGPGATFGHRDVAMLEGFEVCRSRPSKGGPPVLHQAAALLFELGVRADTPTHEAAKILKDSGYGELRKLTVRGFVDCSLSHCGGSRSTECDSAIFENLIVAHVPGLTVLKIGLEKENHP